MGRSQAVSTAQVASSPSASNPVINGAFDIWQRGTSFSLAASTAAASGFLADRWQTTTGANQACTISRQSVSDTTNLPSIQYCLRYQRNSGQTGTGGLEMTNTFETANSIPFAGKTVTLSFYARAGANYSPTSSLLAVYLVTGTGTDQNIWGAGFTGSATPINSTATLTTTWQRFSFTGTVAATVTQMGVDLRMNPTGTASTNDYYEVTGVQIDVGTVALPFRRNSGTLQGELAACQRYYYLVVSNDSRGLIGGGQYNGSTTVDALVPFPTTMRAEPSLVSTTGSNYYIFRANATDDQFDALTIMGEVTTNNGGVYTTSGVSGTSGHGGNLYTGSTSASVAFSAEL